MRAIALTCIPKETSWLFQRGKGKATHAKEAEVCGYCGGTDGAIGGFGEGFDVDDCFYIVRKKQNGVSTKMNMVETLLTRKAIF